MTSLNARFVETTKKVGMHAEVPLGDAKPNEKANQKKALPNFIFANLLAEMLFKLARSAFTTTILHVNGRIYY